MNNVGTILVTDTVKFATTPPTIGSFNLLRPGYNVGVGTWNGYSYQSMSMYRGGGIGASTTMVLKTAADSNIIHVRISDIRGDGINTESQRIQGYLAGTLVPATFKDPVNGATVAGNIVKGATTTTALVQSAMRIFFNGPVDSIVVTSVGFSDFVIIELAARCDALLPLSDLKFNGIAKDDRITLNWTTSNINYASALVEHSVNGFNFSTLPGVAEKAALSAFRVNDHDPAEGRNIYRLTLKSSTGATLAVKTIQVSYHRIAANIYPNPVADIVQLRFPKKILSYAIFSINGVRVKQSIISPSASLTISVNELKAGAYLLQVFLEDGSTVGQRLIKE